MDYVIKGITLLALSGVLMFISNRIQIYFDRITYKERADGSVYRTDGRQSYWGK